MERLGWEGYPGTRVYFAEADSSAQSLYEIDRFKFDVSLKGWLLLADHVILSTGHLLESDITYQWLCRTPGVRRLAEQRALLPSLRDERSSISEYATVDPLSHDKPLTLTQNASAIRDRAAELDDLFSHAIIWSATSESSWFKESLVTDLNDRRSPLRRRLIGVALDDIERLRTAVNDVDFLTREKLQKLVRQHCFRNRRLVTQFGDIYYYLSGAYHKAALPALPGPAAALCMDATAHRGAVATGQPYDAQMWQEVCRLLEIDPMLLAATSLDTISAFRQDSVGIKLRETWRRIVNASTNGSSWTEPAVSLGEQLRTAQTLLAQEMTLQRSRLDKWDTTKQRLEFLSWITGGGATVVGAAIDGGLTGGALGVFSFLVNRQAIGSAEKRWFQTALPLASSRLAELHAESRSL